jgi:hypothetical protein
LLPTHGPRDFVQALVQAEHHADAVRFIAHALPRREGIWWAWVCARRMAGGDPPPAIRTALEITERWISQPTDELRRSAFTAAEGAEFRTPAGCTALAVFFSGGSIAPPDAPAVPPAEFATASAITGAIVSAAVSTEPEKAPEKFQAFIAQGLDVVEKLKLW